MIKHLKSFCLFFLIRQQVAIESPYDVQQSLRRVMELNNHAEVRVRKTKRGHLLVFGAQHGLRANVLPVLDGALEERDGGAILRGHIGLDPGIRIGLGVICFFTFVFFPIRLGIGSGNVPYFVGPLVLLCLLVYFYRIGRDDSAKIARNVKRVLSG